MFISSPKTVVVLLGVGACFASPFGHRHNGHHHAHGVIKREATASAPVEAVVTVVVYELAGKPISYNEVVQGLNNGTLVWADAPVPAPSVEQIMSSTSQSESATSAFSQAPDNLVEPTAVPYEYDFDNPDGIGLENDFPDGQLGCTSFPTNYGAIAVDWLGLQGWTGIQSPRVVSDAGLDDILTMTADLCADGQCCAEGSYCSYSCPPGYQKSQWPSTQGMTGQSIGGLLCKGGKLWLTNSALSSKLCIPGTMAVSIRVHNRMGSHAAVCRTDYPGTESETIPLLAIPGNVYNLTCPDGASYYKSRGLPTSAQYYVNPAGVDVKDACQWGDGSRPIGNFAPLNIGVGYNDNAAYISIFPNKPTTNAMLEYSVEIVGDGDAFDNLSGRCRYTDGQFCGGDDYSDCNPDGCTVSLSYGTATYVFSS